MTSEKKRVEREQTARDFPQVEILPRSYSIIAHTYHNLAVPNFYSSFQGPPQKKKQHFLTGLSLHWSPEIFGSSFKNPTVFSYCEKISDSFCMTRADLYLCFCIAMQLIKT